MEEQHEDQQEQQEELAYDPYLDGDGIPSEELIRALVEGEALFQARGTARVKIGPRIIQVPIKSVDMEEITKALAHRKPRAPVERVLVRAESPEGKEAGLTKNKWVEVAKEADPAYQAALSKYNTELGLLIVLAGLDIPLEDKGGNTVWDPQDPSRQDKEGALRILKGMGMTGWQFSAISDAIQNLTRIKEDEVEKN